MEQKYKDSIIFKLKSAKYHYENIHNVLSDNFNYDDKLVAISSEVTSFLLVYQSIFDILAQYINLKRNLNLNPKRLYFHDIVKISNKIPDLREFVHKLDKANEYINAYCNTVKHRNLIKVNTTQVHQTAMIGLGMHMGVHTYHSISSFKRNNRQFNMKPIPEYINETQDELQSAVEELMSLI